jgi:acetyltransferase-like isoleucine patch superfamily enzyme
MLTIGADTIIGSGAVVVKDCEASSVYVGCPARKVR